MICEFTESCYRARLCDIDPLECTSRKVCLGEMDMTHLLHKRQDVLSEIGSRELMNHLRKHPWDSRHGTIEAVEAGCVCWRCRAYRSRRFQLRGIFDEEGS